MNKLADITARLDYRQLPETAAVLFAGLLLGLFPLALISDYGAITRGKFFILAFMCCDFGLALLLSLLWTGRLRPPRQWTDGWTLPSRWLLLFGLAALISALLSPYGSLTLLGSGRWEGMLTLGLELFIVLSLAELGRWLDIYYDITALAALLLAGLCLWQLAGGNPLGLYPPGLTYADGGHLYQSRFLGTIGNVDMLSACWCLLLPLLLGGTLLLPGRRRVLPALALLAGAGVELAADVSSGPLALLLSALLIGPLLLRGRRRRLVWIAAALALAAGLALVYVYHGPEQGSLWELSRVLHGDIRDEFGSSRVLIWKEAWASRGQGIGLLLGSGPGTRAQHFTTVFERLDESGALLRAAVDSSHNEYLDLLLETGAAGLGLYLAAIAATLPALWRAAGRNDRQAVMLGWSWCAYLLQALFNFSSVVVTPLFWTVWGLLLARLRGPAPPLLSPEEQ
ncbi:MAG: O-antigen ligase family protein [Firmicutes bacterium]|nr:O-antigen ligase family protein [Bacillota bacterium]